MTSLTLSPELSLPPDTVTRALALVAQRGSGKTYTARVLAEEMIEKGLPVVIIDPLGVLYGLALSPDGRSAGLPVAVLGGAHGHVPITPENGRIIAGFLADSPRPVVIDLSEFRKSGMREFMTAFAEELYHRKNTDRVPLHLILDEADLFIPQRPQKGEERMLGAFEDIVRRGRSRGLGITMITQRPAVIHKDVLTQVDALVMLRLAGPQDKKAVEAWIDIQADRSRAEKVLRELPSLPIGTAWFWSPGWLNILRKIRVRQARTFDSSKTPEVGAVGLGAELPPVDLEELRGMLSGKKPKKGKKGKVPEAALVTKLRTSSAYGELKLYQPPPQSNRPMVLEIALMQIYDRLDRLERDVKALAQGEVTFGPGKIDPRFPVGTKMPAEEERAWKVAADIAEWDSFPVNPPPSGPSIIHTSREGFSEMEETLYQKFKARLIDEAPAFLRLLSESPEIHVTERPKILELDDSTIQGKIALLIAEGFFVEPQNGNRVYKELLRRGAKTAAIKVYDECGELTALGFLTKEKDGFRAAPSAKVVRKAG